MRKGTVAARLDSGTRARRTPVTGVLRRLVQQDGLCGERCPSTLILPRVCHPAFPEENTRGAMSSAKVARASRMASCLTIIRAVGSVLDPTKIACTWTSEAPAPQRLDDDRRSTPGYREP